jgi:cobaltochelatase CobT
MLLHSPRTIADIQAMTVFREQAFHQPDLQIHAQKPGGIRNALLQARAEILGGRKYPGVGRNIIGALAELNLSTLHPDQRAYLQLWCKAYPDRLQEIHSLVPAVESNLIDMLDLSLQDEERFLQCLAQIPPVDATPYQEDEVQADIEYKASEDAMFSEEEPSEREMPLDSGDVDPSGVLQPEKKSPAWAGYKIFDRRFDRVVPAAQLTGKFDYADLRGRLFQDLPDYELLTRRLVNRLRRVLLVLQRRSWLYDQEEGWLNPSRLASWVAAPATIMPFRQETDNLFPDTAFTLLLDCSGSMRGQPILMAAACIDVLTQALEQCGIRVEVLGYTTGAWDDGPVAKAWTSSGKPECAGRLNQMQYVIFKEFSQPWRRARQSLGAVLNDQWLRENIDGESLWWAYQRLKIRPELRKIMVVVSDGLPRDEMTDAHNEDNYLAQHLRQVIAEIEGANIIDLYAIGVGHSVERFYRQAISISHMQGLAHVLTKKLISIFEHTIVLPGKSR